MAANAAFTTERLAIARPGDILTVGPWQVELATVMPTAGKNWTAVEAELLASRGSGVITLAPQSRYYSDPPTQTSESAIRSFWNGQLYTVLGRQDGSGAWQLRLWWKPFVTLIWGGGALIAIGGALALLGRLWRLAWRRGTRSEFEWRQERYA
jgi:cytochrome c-type biogenesis protein CcmF